MAKVILSTSPMIVSIKDMNIGFTHYIKLCSELSLNSEPINSTYP